MDDRAGDRSEGVTRRRVGVDEEICGDLERASALEWVEANGRGGYASGTVSGVATRRYHGLLLIASFPPHKRVMLVNHLVEEVETPTGGIFLSTAGGSDSATEDGYRRCRGFFARPVPEWTYDLDGGSSGLTVIRSVVCPRGRDAVVIRWQVVGSDGQPVRLRVRPMLTVRSDHEVVSAEEPIATDVRVADDAVSWQPRGRGPRIYAAGARSYEHAPEWRRGIEYVIDRERGEPCREDWWSPGALSLVATTSEPAFLTLAIEGDVRIDGRLAFDAELARRQRMGNTITSGGSVLHDELIVAAESYIVQVDERVALLAGFPWFDVWTRDTFTAFGGLLLATGHVELAGRILKTFTPLVDGGLLPNNLPDASTPARWTSVDASLWFIVAVGRYAKAAWSDPSVLAAVWPAVRGILEGYAAGTAHVSIGVDDDGLLRASDAEAPLTWMDAQCQGRVMTPRRGKPVEVQALWIQALDVAAALGKRLGQGAQVKTFEQARRRASLSFQARFWNEAGGYLFDVIDGPEGDDATFRPNQLFALAFDASLVDEERGRRILELTRLKLLTPKGLRTLPDDDASFHERYVGPRPSRDAAYHQGTVWPFLLAPFVTAWLRFHRSTKEARREASSFLTGIEEHLLSEGCLGHLSEIFDGSPPHAPRGCFAQAWSLGEILLAVKEIQAGES